MYIQSSYKQVNEYKLEKEYKSELKELCNLNLRRNSKFNVMAILGVLKTLKDSTYTEDLSIYIASEYGCVEDLIKVLEQINSEDSMLMPFDFLNINTNNTGFLISQALNTIGNNINITSEDLSFEKAFSLAYFDFKINNKKDILVGGVDESIENITNYNSIIHNLENSISKDASCWIYLNDKQENSVGIVEFFDFFTCIDDLNLYLEKAKYDFIGLNQFARKYQDELNINYDSIFENKDNFCGVTSVADIIDLINKKNGSLIYVSLDSKKRAYLFHFNIH